MNLVILGAAGSGKGTQAKLLTREFDLNYLEMGEMLRDFAASDHPLAQTANEYIDRGELVPEELTQEIIWEHIQKLDKTKGFLFDGYPRTVEQYEHLKELLAKLGQKPDKVIYLEVSEVAAIKRLSARRMHQKTGQIYNLITNPPPLSVDKSDLIQRDDDKPAAIKKRLEIFRKETFPVVELAKKEGVLLELDGERPIGEIFAEIKAQVKE